MDSGRRSNMSEMTNEEGFYPEDPIEEIFEQPVKKSESAPSRKKKRGKKNKNKKENDVNIGQAIVGFFRGKNNFSYFYLLVKLN